MPPRTSAALPLLGQEKDGRAAAYPDVITVTSHTKKGNPAGLPSQSSSPPAAPGHPYVLTRNAGGQQASQRLPDRGIALANAGGALRPARD